ncbi:26S protease regulatory subunit 10B [Orchesella cincta]|uniref:26S protease regulatory subunit 10B n=1 Tax=Orchesella cincta TaxID=48709 RepID=A0A1D2MY14_ORCCI|nr:26S protease regulatory subunit 10B [Orchesella cincta]
MAAAVATMPATGGGPTGDPGRERAIAEYKRKVAEHRDIEAKLKDMREQLSRTNEAIRQVRERFESTPECWTDKFIVKATNGPRYVVGCRRQLDKTKLKSGTRVALDMTTLTIMSYWRSFEQIRELREVIELPLMNPELFQRVGITPPKGCLLYGPPGTGKTLLARAVASQLDANFLKVVSSAIVDKYIGESARLIREMFNYARDHQPCIIFMDEIDAIGGSFL